MQCHLPYQDLICAPSQAPPQIVMPDYIDWPVLIVNSQNHYYCILSNGEQNVRKNSNFTKYQASCCEQNKCFLRL